MWKNQWRLIHHQRSLLDSVTTFIRGTHGTSWCRNLMWWTRIFPKIKATSEKNNSSEFAKKNEQKTEKSFFRKSKCELPGKVFEGVEGDDVGVVFLQNFDFHQSSVRRLPGHAEDGGSADLSRRNVLGLKHNRVDLVGGVVADDA